MPVIPLPPRAHVSLLNEPAKILGMTIVVVVRCQQCQAGEELALVNAQPAICPHCGASVGLERIGWERTNPVPSIALNATPPRAQAFS